MAYQPPRYTQVPNILLDEQMPHLNKAELKIVLAVCRQTIGYHKTKDRLSISRMEQLTGLSRRTITRTLPKLLGQEEEEALICREPDGESYTYRLALTDSQRLSTIEREGRGTMTLPQENSEPSRDKMPLVTCMSHRGIMPPTKERTSLNKEQQHTCALARELLVDNSVSEEVADRLLDTYGAEQVETQLHHLYHLLASGKPPVSPAAWLVSAVKFSYTVPAAADTSKPLSDLISLKRGKGRDNGAARQSEDVVQPDSKDLPDWRGVLEAAEDPTPRKNRHQQRRNEMLDTEDHSSNPSDHA